MAPITQNFAMISELMFITLFDKITLPFKWRAITMQDMILHDAQVQFLILTEEIPTLTEQIPTFTEQIPTLTEQIPTLTELIPTFTELLAMLF